jgi:nicotinamide-nucleotide adenylyltransferase
VLPQPARSAPPFDTASELGVAEAFAGKYGRVGMVARWRPVHRGHVAVIDALLDGAHEVVLGLGSSNRYDLRNPWTAAEVRQMLDAVIAERPGVTVVDVPDLDDPPRWGEMVREQLGPLDLYLTANPWVRDVMAPHYAVAHPVGMVPPERRVPVDGTAVRLAMARGGGAWRELVPVEVQQVLDAGGLVQRFRREFGLQTLARLAAP